MGELNCQKCKNSAKGDTLNKAFAILVHEDDCDFKITDLVYDKKNVEGVLVCTGCNEKAIGRDFQEADEEIDHSKALSRGIDCDASPLKLRWNDQKVAKLVYLIGKTESKPKNTKSSKGSDSKSETKEEKPGNDDSSSNSPKSDKPSDTTQK